MIYELNHAGIVIRDWEKSLAFYQDVLGARVVARNFIPANQTDVAYLQIAGGLIELLHRRQPATGEVFGITHIGFMTDDLDADYRALVHSGCEGVVPPKVAGTGIGRLGFLLDPNRARVELLQREVDFRTAPIEHGIIKSFDHYSVRANNLAAAKDFYGRRLGMAPLKQMHVEQSQLSILYFHFKYDVVELLHRPTPDAGDIFGHVALRVEDVDRALEHFAAQGVPPSRGPPSPPGPGLAASESFVIPTALRSSWSTGPISATSSGRSRCQAGPLRRKAGRPGIFSAIPSIPWYPVVTVPGGDCRCC